MEVTTAEGYASGGPGREPETSNVYEAFLRTVDRIGGDVAIRTEDDSVSVTWNELSAWVSRIAGGLEGLGLEKGETVALMLNNRPEFIPCDLAAVSLGGVPFSIYQTSSPDQIAYVVGDAGSRIAIIESAFLENFNKARENLPDVEHVIVIDGEGGTDTLAGLESANPGFDPSERAAGVGLDDLLTLIYTSGTTGPPKGVQLTHRNLMALTTSVEGIDRDARARRPPDLVAADGAHRRARRPLLPAGGQGAHRDDLSRPAPDRRVHSEGQALLVLRRAEDLREAQGRARGPAREPPRRAADTGREGARGGDIEGPARAGAGRRCRRSWRRRSSAPTRSCSRKLRAALGLDELAAVNVGAAPTPLEVLEFFHAIGIPVGELWGMSETCGVATLNPPEKIKLGTVGPPVPGVEIKLASDGEVLVKRRRDHARLPEHAREDGRD